MQNVRMYVHIRTCIHTCSIPTVLTRAIFAFLMVISCCAMTDRTSMSILLNSSKQHQAPDWASPEKNLPIIYAQGKKEVRIFVDVALSLHKYKMYIACMYGKYVCIYSNIRNVYTKKNILGKKYHENGAAGYRSQYLSHAKRALYHLSYSPHRQEVHGKSLF